MIQSQRPLSVTRAGPGFSVRGHDADVQNPSASSILVSLRLLCTLEGRQVEAGSGGRAGEGDHRRSG